MAEFDGAIAGFGQVEPPGWNGRATVAHLYVSAPFRGRGLGAALLEALAEHARAAEARCLWAETQNVNYPAVHFYLANGFYLCGLDQSFYDPVELPGEIALFLARSLSLPCAFCADPVTPRNRGLSPVHVRKAIQVEQAVCESGRTSVPDQSQGLSPGHGPESHGGTA